MMQRVSFVAQPLMCPTYVPCGCVGLLVRAFVTLPPPPALEHCTFPWRAPILELTGTPRDERDYGPRDGDNCESRVPSLVDMRGERGITVEPPTFGTTYVATIISKPTSFPTSSRDKKVRFIVRGDARETEEIRQSLAEDREAGHPRVEAEPRAGSNLQGRLQLLVSVLGQDLSGTSWCGQPVSGTGKVRRIKCVI